MQLSIPEVPSYAELTAATSNVSVINKNEGELPAEEQSLRVLDMADEASKLARKEWEALSKMDAQAARCVDCEGWWRNSVQNVIRACIICSIAISTMKKGAMNAKHKPVKHVLHAEMPEHGKTYHDFWVVPKLTIEGFLK